MKKGDKDKERERRRREDGARTERGFFNCGKDGGRLRMASKENK